MGAVGGAGVVGGASSAGRDGNGGIAPDPPKGNNLEKRVMGVMGGIKIYLEIIC